MVISADPELRTRAKFEFLVIYPNAQGRLVSGERAFVYVGGARESDDGEVTLRKLRLQPGDHMSLAIYFPEDQQHRRQTGDGRR